MTRHPTFTGRRVLLVEDEPRLREMLLRAIREMSFKPSGVSSAEQALRLLEQQPHPILIVDLNLPGASGMELLRTARGRWPHIQAIILTGFGDLNAARQAIHLDVVDFLTKPCALGDLEVALDRAFHRLLNDHPTALAPTAVERGRQPIRVLEADADEQENNVAVTGDSRRVGSNSLAHFNRLSRWHSSRATATALCRWRTSSGGLFLPSWKSTTGNRSSAAAELGISLRKLYYRLAQYQKRGLPLP